MMPLYIVILIASIARFALGGIWYMNKGLFGKAWLRAQGVDPHTPMVGGGKAMSLGFLFTVISTTALALIVALGGNNSFSGNVILGFFFWICFVAPLLAQSVIYDPKKQKSWKLFWIDGIYELLSIIVGLVVIAWLV